MLSYVALALAALALWRCPFWGAGKRVFLPLYLWALYCALAPINIFGFYLLDYRWPAAVASGITGIVWWLTTKDRHSDVYTKLWALFIGLSAMSTAWSRMPDYTLGRALALLPIFCLTILGARSLVLRQGGPEAVGICVLVAHAIPPMLSFSLSFEQDVYIETTFGSDSSRFQGYSKATGTAHAIVTAFPFLFWYVRHGKYASRVANLGAFGYLTYLLLATRTRASLATALLIIPMGWSAIISRRGKGGAAVAAFAFLAALGIGLQFVNNDSLQGFARTRSTEDLLRTRMDGRWDRIWEQSCDSPIIGHGLGTVRFYQAPNATFDFSAADESRRMFQSHTHNEYLSLFYDLGFLPPILFTLFVIATMKAGFKWMGAAGSRMRDFMVALFLSTTADIINTVSHDGLMTVGNPSATFFWIKCIMLLTISPELRK